MSRTCEKIDLLASKFIDFFINQADLFNKSCFDVQLINILLSIAITAFVSYLGFKVYLLSDINYEEIEKYIDKMKVIKENKDKTKYYNEFACYYSVFNSFIVITFSYIQFNKANIPIAVLYGTIGPYLFREKAVSWFGKQLESNIKKEASNISSKERK